ncbi:probable polygalacturonase At3g15720 [Lotus japonicus]|uniref:probable polygalacturonase At3g15720 n=1 Tax=Lotus japonicus TaxID=34305 RepID=UPI002584F21C|nr:probable polygalacturonase At3g15720 [Lotus japonicus]
MLGLLTCLLILGFASQCLCVRWNDVAGTYISYNVMDNGARGDGISDDSKAFLSAWQKVCATEGRATLVIPPRKIFMVTNLFLDGPCKAIRRSSMIRISFVNALIVDGGGIIDGYGSTWWNLPQSPRPVMLSFHACNNLLVRDLMFTNSPGAHITVDGSINAVFSHVNIQAPANSPNTDGFDIANSRNILIEDSNIGTGDDCIAINGGTAKINATRLVCGPGHGISIGSLGRNRGHETVEEIYVQNCSFIGTTNGARIKTVEGGSGYARKIYFEQIQLVGVYNPIIIDQHYGPRQPKEDSAVKVSDARYLGFTGTSASDLAINIDCSSFGCSNILLDQINIAPSQAGKKIGTTCKNARGATVGNAIIPSVSCL